MIKKLTVVFLCLVMLCLAGCGGNAPTKTDNGDKSKPASSTAKTEEKETKKLNPLTGLYDLDEGKQNDRPVAVMINNLSTAKKVQTGLTAADIIYETEVEGGITRLMALFQDISKVPQIGTVRSARYAYVDLALGHDALYIHCGTDMTYCKPHLNDIDSVWIEDNVCGGKRISNGLAREHTLYAVGSKVWQGLKAEGFDTEKDDTTLWQNFTSAKEVVIPSGADANNVTVTFSNSYKTSFTFDAASKRYAVDARKDYKTGEAVTVKNVFVLLTTITSYPDGYHKKVALENGMGYYISNGKAMPIYWSKGKGENPFTFTDENGNQLKVNAGNSWVCIANKNNVPSIK